MDDMRTNPASMFYASFGEHLLALRFRTGLSQTQLAVAAGVRRQGLVRWEQGEAFPQSATLQRLIAALARHRAFTPGHEADEATALWEQANAEGSRRFPIFDEDWFATLVTRIPQAATSPPLFDWGDAAVAPLFHGRDADLAQLRHWVMDEGCRVVGIFGAGGVGKSSLAINFAHGATHHFEVIIFRSLRNAPPLHETLQSMLRSFRLPESQDAHTIQPEALRTLLRERRCLIIFDNLETIMQAGERLGEYRPGYADYGELIRLIAESAHRSCLLVTSRERPRHFRLLEQQAAAVRSLVLQGLSLQSCQALLAPLGILGEVEDWQRFAQHYSGNPLSMKLVAETIRNRFDGNLAAFLRHSDAIPHEMSDVLAAQIERTSDPEYALLLWLAIEREPASAQQLARDVAGAISDARVLQALETLLQRTVIERVKDQDTFSLQLVVQEFLIEQFVERVASELQQGRLELVCRYALLQGTAKEYVRQSQLRLIIEPCLARLRTQRGSSEAVVAALTSYLDALRDVPIQQQRYGGSNLAHLLAHERGNLRSVDLSGLMLLQPNFAGVAMQRADLRGAYVHHALFSGQLFINALAWHPNGERLASGSGDDTVTVWDSSRGERIETLPLQTNCSQSLCYSHDGAWLAGGGRDGIIRAWHAGRRELLELRGHSDQVTATTTSSDGQHLASASYDGRVAIWSIRDGTLLGLLGRTSQMILAAAWHPRQDIIASGGMDERITLWDVRRGEPHAILQDYKSFVRAVAWSSDGLLLASSDFDGVITVWDWQRQTARVRFAGHTKEVWLVAFHPNQPIVASGSEDGTVRLWDVTSGAPLAVFDGGLGAVRSLAWSPEGRRLASGGAAGWIIIWDVETKRELRRFRNERPYENMRIAGIHGITSDQYAMLLALGADDTA